MGTIHRPELLHWRAYIRDADLQKVHELQAPGPKDRASFPQPQTEALGSFVGGFLVLFGARMANGCASGHILSG
ncbi:MAG: YeeE/YedE thiosulfate transporter family protein, partial [Thermoplasmata archaeon]